MKYGWIPDTPDHRDLTFKSWFRKKDLPKKASLLTNQPLIYDQQNLGSCTANAICAAFDYIYFKQHGTFLNPSRLFIYYGEREKEGNIDFDAGAQIRTGIKYIVKYGTCKELTWPYLIDKFKEKPPKHAYEEAKNFQAVQYERISSFYQLKSAIAEGLPVVCGISVYDSFESQYTTDTGIVKFPGKDENLLGGHAIALEEYDDEKELVTFRNSYGEEWGNHGFGYLPYSYFTNSLTDDFWAIRTTE